MKPSIETKLNAMHARYDEISGLLSNAEVMKNQDRFRELSKEFSKLEPLVQVYKQYQETCESLTETQEMLEEADSEMRELAMEESTGLAELKEQLEQKLKTLLLPEDPNDQCNVYLEVRAGTGGDEAAIFAGDLFRMYSRYAEQNKWKVEVMSAHEGEHGGYKEIISRIIGQGVYSRLKFESGAHRVQRVPETESQGRIHTSACTVAILPEAEAVEEVEISPADLRIDTYRSSGAGGQHVNTTDSAVRITHLPTGVVVECQDERSQHKNKARAMSLLQAKILSEERDRQEAEQAQTRRNLVGSGDRSERIRTYNFPQGRITDHRINLTLYKLDEVIAGALDQVIEPLIREHQADQMAAIND